MPVLSSRQPTHAAEQEEVIEALQGLVYFTQDVLGKDVQELSSDTETLLIDLDNEIFELGEAYIESLDANSELVDANLKLSIKSANNEVSNRKMTMLIRRLGDPVPHNELLDQTLELLKSESSAMPIQSSLDLGSRGQFKIDNEQLKAALATAIEYYNNEVANRLKV
jgi:hypothetical protein